jgi:hypothetical protein
MRFVFALFSLAVVLFSIDVEGWPANPGASPAAAAGNSAAQGRPFEELQGQIDALNAQVHVFFEDAGVTASYSPQGFLHPIDPTAVRYESDDCTGPAFYDVAGVAGRSRDGAFLFRVMVAGTVTQEVLVGSRVGEAPRIGPVCVLFSPPIPTPLVPVQFFDPADVDIPIQVAPVLMVAPAE